MGFLKKKKFEHIFEKKIYVMASYFDHCALRMCKTITLAVPKNLLRIYRGKLS